MSDSPAVQIPRIRCAICNTMVDTVEWWDDPAQAVRSIRVTCHGSSDTMHLTTSDYMRLGQRGMDAMVSSEGLAFSTLMLKR